MERGWRKKDWGENDFKRGRKWRYSKKSYKNNWRRRIKWRRDYGDGKNEGREEKERMG